MKKPSPSSPSEPERIAKVMARAGLCSRREAETWIADGRVSLNGQVLTTPAVTVGPGDTVLVDGQPLPEKERTRLFLYHKPRGLVTTNHDPEGRPTVFDHLPADLPRVVSVGRLDINTEGLLLLTNDGGLARVLELPATGWLRRYRVRAHGEIDQPALDKLRDGVAIDGILYGAVEATLDRRQGDNVWLTVGLREGKNREVKNILGHLGMDVTRLIRVSFGPFQLGDIKEGEATEIPRRILKDQLGPTLIEESGADLEAREEDRKPKMPPRGTGIAEAPAGRSGERPMRRPDAKGNRRRHEADLAHEDEPARPAARRAAAPGRPTLSAKTGMPSAAAGRSSEPPSRQLSRGEATARRKEKTGERAVAVERRERRPADAAEERRPASRRDETRGEGHGRPSRDRPTDDRRQSGASARQAGHPGPVGMPGRGPSGRRRAPRDRGRTRRRPGLKGPVGMPHSRSPRGRAGTSAAGARSAPLGRTGTSGQPGARSTSNHGRRAASVRIAVRQAAASARTGPNRAGSPDWKPRSALGETAGRRGSEGGEAFRRRRKSGRPKRRPKGRDVRRGVRWTTGRAARRSGPARGEAASERFGRWQGVRQIRAGQERARGRQRSGQERPIPERSGRGRAEGSGRSQGRCAGRPRCGSSAVGSAGPRSPVRRPVRSRSVRLPTACGKASSTSWSTASTTFSGTPGSWTSSPGPARSASRP